MKNYPLVVSARFTNIFLCFLQCPHTTKQRKRKNVDSVHRLLKPSLQTFPLHTQHKYLSQSLFLFLSQTHTHTHTLLNPSHFNHGGRTLRRHNLEALPPPPPPSLSQSNPSHTPFLSLENFPPHNLPEHPKVVTFHRLCPHARPQTKHPHGN